MKTIYLASTSPRRKELLHQLIGDNFKIINSEFEEDNNQPLSPHELVKVHSLGKAKAAAKNLKEGIVIGSDCIVYYNGKVLGKPHTLENAKRILKEISGKEIEVYTGIALIDIESRRELVDYDKAKLKIKNLTRDEIENYVEFEKPTGNSGGFNIHTKGAFLVEKIEGDYYSIVGLPLFKLNLMLNELNVSIFDFKNYNMNIN